MCRAEKTASTRSFSLKFVLATRKYTCAASTLTKYFTDIARDIVFIYFVQSRRAICSSVLSLQMLFFLFFFYPSQPITNILKKKKKRDTSDYRFGRYCFRFGHFAIRVNTRFFPPPFFLFFFCCKIFRKFPETVESTRPAEIVILKSVLNYVKRLREISG